jgi:hypothetical protein
VSYLKSHFQHGTNLGPESASHRITTRQCKVRSSAQTWAVNMEKEDYPQHVEVMEKAGYPQQLEAGLLVVPDGSDAPMVVSELPQAVNSGMLPARTGSARRDGQLYPMGSEALEHAPKKDDSDDETLGRNDVRNSVRNDVRDPKTVVVKRRTAWIVALVILLVVVAAVIGGAVGGTRRSKKNSSGVDALDASSSTRFVASPIKPHNLPCSNSLIAHLLKAPLLPQPPLQHQQHRRHRPPM